MLSKTFKQLCQSVLQWKVGIWVMSTLLLFLGFYTNYWGVAHQKWFDTHQRDTEGHIMGRMVKSRQDGIFSAGGLTGDGSTANIPEQLEIPSPYNWQYKAYLNNLSFDKFSTYNSQPGGQGMIFSLLDKLIPLSPKNKLEIFYVLTALLTAIALTLILAWFYQEFGLLAAVFVLGSALFSHWLTVFGKNLWWSTWAFYLPMIAVMYYIKYNRIPLNRQHIWFCIIIFFSVSIKCFINGFEYITTTLIMMMTPCIYYAILDKWNINQCLKWLIAAGIGTGAAIFLSLIMLCYQIGAVKGGFMHGIEHVIWSFGKRTYGEAKDYPDVYAASMEAGTIRVVITYMKGIFFDLNNYISVENTFISNIIFKVRYYYLIGLFAVISVLQLWRSNSLETKRNQYIALIITTWFSILAPMSWFIIFKAHSFIHTHMSFLLWQMPFTLFGFAVIGTSMLVLRKKMD